jgi:hypothetical protein
MAGCDSASSWGGQNFCWEAAAAREERDVDGFFLKMQIGWECFWLADLSVQFDWKTFLVLGVIEEVQLILLQILNRNHFWLMGVFFLACADHPSDATWPSLM